MKTNSFFRTAVVLGAVLAAPAASAQLTETPERSGTSGAEYLTLPVTARTASLASAFTGGLDNASGLEGLMLNPAALSVSDGTGATFSRMNYLDDVGINHFGVSQSIGNNDIAVFLWDFTV